MLLPLTVLLPPVSPELLPPKGTTAAGTDGKVVLLQSLSTAALLAHLPRPPPSSPKTIFSHAVIGATDAQGMAGSSSVPLPLPLMYRPAVLLLYRSWS